MKVGMRKPSIKKSVKARTTGKVKRAVKKSVNPLYGQKGVGFVKDPERSVKNAIYHQTTVGVSDLVKDGAAPSKGPTANGAYVTLLTLFASLIIISLIVAIVLPVPGIVLIIIGIAGIIYTIRKMKRTSE